MSSARSAYRLVRNADYLLADGDEATHPPGCPMAVPWYRNFCTRIDELAEFCCCCRDRPVYDSKSVGPVSRFRRGPHCVCACVRVRGRVRRV